jgi:UDP-3-O-[3-hydroxymyristoyl] N-acetylglucosamine deacetylase
MIIDVNGPEVPAMDGSAKTFVENIISSGVARQASNRPYLKVTKPVIFNEGRTEIAILPYEGRMISYQIDFDHRILGHQKMEMDFTADSFRQGIAPARTFGFFKDVENLKSMGLALGGSLDNAIVIDETGIMNPSGLRFPDEFIRHKMLDFIGDISLSGFPILGHFAVNRSGHTSNTKFLRRFLQSTDCWEIVSDVERSLKASA